MKHKWPKAYEDRLYDLAWHNVDHGERPDALSEVDVHELIDLFIQGQNVPLDWLLDGFIGAWFTDHADRKRDASLPQTTEAGDRAVALFFDSKCCDLLEAMDEALYQTYEPLIRQHAREIVEQTQRRSEEPNYDPTSLRETLEHYLKH